jgi:hypothetical protein
MTSAKPPNTVPVRKCRYCGLPIRQAAISRIWLAAESFVCKSHDTQLFHEPMVDTEVVDKVMSKYYEI